MKEKQRSRKLGYKQGFIFLLAIFVALLTVSYSILPAIANSSQNTHIGGASTGSIMGSVQLDELNFTSGAKMRSDSGNGPTIATLTYPSTLAWNSSWIQTGAALLSPTMTGTVSAQNITSSTGSLQSAGTIVFAKWGSYYVGVNRNTGAILYNGTDAATQINAAISAYPNGALIHLNTATSRFDLSTTINVNGNNTVLECDGSWAGNHTFAGGYGLYLNNGVNLPMINMTGLRSVVRHCFLYGNISNNPTGMGISIHQGSYNVEAKIEDVFVDYAATGINIKQDAASNFLRDILIENGVTGLINKGTFTTFDNIWSASNSGVGISEIGVDNFYTNCVSKLNTGDGVNINGAGSRDIFEGCSITSNGGDGYDIAYSALSGLIISNNMIKQNQQHGIKVNDGLDLQIKNNQIRDSSYTHNNTYSGIYLTGGVNYADISGNLIITYTGTAKPKYDIEINSGTLNKIHDNIFHDYATKAVLVATNNEIYENTGYVTENGGAATVANGGTVTHGLSATPTYVLVTGSNSSNIYVVTAIGTTTFTVGVRDYNGANYTATSTVYWQAVYKP